MSKIISQAFVIGIACLIAVTYLWAENNTATEQNNTAVAKNDTANEQNMWVGVTVHITNEDENEYLIGTIDKAILDEIELDKYKRRFLRISNLRIQEEIEETDEGDTLLHYVCADEYDLGIILFRYQDIVSIELKKCDPLDVE